MSNILKFSDACSLAIHSVVYLAAWPEKCFSTRDISEKLSVSDNHLAKVLQRLAKEDIVIPVRGPKGGFKLGKNAEQIKLLDIYEIFEGPMSRTSNCLLSKKICNGDDCVLGDLLNTITDQVSTYLNKTSISQLTHIFTGDQDNHSI